MSGKLTTMAMAAAALMGSANAFQLENFLDPVMSERLSYLGDYLTGGEGLDVAKVLDSASRTFLNITLGTSSLITYNNALLLILVISAGIFIVLALLAALAYLTFTGTTVGAFVGKRSLPDEDDGLDLNWTRVLQVIEAMEEQFRRAGLADEEEECRKKTLCLLAEKKGKLAANHSKADDAHTKLYKLANELSEIHENQVLDDSRPELKSSFSKFTAYHGASEHGRKRGQCESAYKKCSKF